MNEQPVPGASEIWTAQLAVAMCVLESLVAHHPEPEKLRATFDQLFDQLIAGMVATGMTTGGSSIMKQIAEKIFSPPGSIA
jgi:hypothetical protein